NERWLGGMLTNYTTILTRVQKLRELDRMQQAGDFEAMPKKEALMKSRELEKLQRNLGGIKGMSRQPDAVFIIDTKKEHIAVTEANKLNIPIVAVVDTNCDPDLIQYVIPGNDDAIRAGNLLCRVIADAVDEGRYIAAKKAGHAAAAAAAARSAEDEARIATEQAEARQQAAAEQADREARLTAASASLTEDAPDAPDAAAEPDGDAAPVDPTPADVAAGEPEADEAAPPAPADA
ncbi:MAG: 30S ribosomal protein S2, partial [Acidimicrobiales bacterium]